MSSQIVWNIVSAFCLSLVSQTFVISCLHLLAPQSPGRYRRCAPG